MTISIIKRSTKFFTPKEGETKKDPEVKEKVLSEFRTDSIVSTAMLQFFVNENTYPIVNKDGDIEVGKFLESNNPKISEEIIIKFAK